MSRGRTTRLGLIGSDLAEARGQYIGIGVINVAFMVQLLLSINHNRGMFCQVAFPRISESTKHMREDSDGTNRVVAESCFSKVS